MNVIYYKILADLWGHKSRTLQVVLIIALGAFGAGLVIGARNLTSAALNADWLAGDPPNMKISVNPAMTSDQLLALEKIDGLSKVEGLQAEKIEWRHGPGEEWQIANLNAREDYTAQKVTRWDLEEGSWPSGDNVAMERGYGALHNLAIGDTIETRINERVRQVTIVGVLNSREINANFSPDLALYMAHRRFGEITGNENYATVAARVDAFNPDGSFNQTRADLIDGEVQERLNKLEIDSQGLMPAIPLIKRVAPATTHFAQGILNSVFLILGIIGGVIVVLGALLIYNNISAIITQQVAQIGIMKAIGARSGQVLWGYLLLIFTYGLLASLVAIPLSALASHAIKLFFTGFMDAAAGGFQIDAAAVFLQVALALFSPLVASLAPLNRGANITVREAISTFGLGGAAGLLDALLARLQNVSYTVLLTIGNTFRNLTRMTLTQLVMVGGGLLFITIMGVSDSTYYTFGSALTDVHNYQVNLTLQDDERIDRVTQLVLEQPGVSAVEVWNTGSASVRPQHQAEYDVNDERASLYGIPLDSQMYAPNLVAGRWLQDGDDKVIAMHQELAARLGVGVGDWVTLRYQGDKEADWQIVGLFFDSARDTGVYMLQSVYGWEMNRVNQGNALFIKTTDTEHEATVRTGLAIRQFLEDSNLPIAVGNLFDAMTIGEIVERLQGRYSIVINLLAIMAVVIGVVGGIGLSGTLSLSVLERTREIGVMRAIGASSARISWLFIGEGLIQGVLSWLIAVPLGIPAAYYMTTVVLSQLFGDTLLYQFTPTGILLWLGIIIVLGIVASWLPARNATRVSVRESLAYQ
jgi:putative ABC transport system permease protein